MSNRGLRSYDTSTDVGTLRLSLGDTNFTEFNPVDLDFVDYDYFGDDSLEAFVESAGENLTRATGYAYRALAGILTLTAASIQTDDLRIDTLGRAKLMRELAADWLSSADAEDDRVGADIFDIVPFGGLSDGGYVRPEATPWIV